MANNEVTNFRNIALVGHGDAGKTTLVETILFKTKTISRLGEVEAGTTTCDFEPDEKDRKNSLDAAVVSCHWGNKTLNIIDTPGYPDFAGEAIISLQAVESGLLTINASSGIMVNTREMWNVMSELDRPRFIVINKLDLPNLKFSELLKSIQDTFGPKCLPLTFPVGLGDSLKGVVDFLVTPPDKIPSENTEAKQWREKLIESAVEVDDALLNKYLDGQAVSADELSGALKRAVRERKIFPVLCVSAKKQVGLDELLDFMVSYLPAPDEAEPKKGVNPESDEKTEVILERTAAAPLSAQVFKCVSDPFVGKISYLRIFSGTVHPDSTVYNSRFKKTQKIGKIFKPFGKEQQPINQAICGDIITTTKVEDLLLFDTLSTPGNPVKYDEIKLPQPMVSLAIEPKSKSDEQRLSTSLAKLVDSDPTFKINRDPQTHELVVTGMSNLHLDIVLHRLKRRYEVQVLTKQPKIPYRETVTMKAEGQYKHKKQSGGHGQYGEVYLRVEPLPHGQGFNFVNDIFGGSVHSQYIPAIEKGVRETMVKGVLVGYPMVDIQVSVFDGSYHDVDSSEASFKIAASKAFQIAVKNARPVLLEPIVNIEISVLTKFLGSITGDLPSRRGRISGMDSLGDYQIVKAMVPLAEVANYSTELRSITGGEGHYTIEFSHYDLVPHKIQEDIVGRLKKDKEEEAE
mgnify:CR=1 FL=1